MKKACVEFLDDFQTCVDAINDGVLTPKKTKTVIANLRTSIAMLRVKAKRTKNKDAMLILKNSELKLTKLREGVK